MRAGFCGPIWESAPRRDVVENGGCGKIADMTKLLEEAIAKVRDLSDDGQDEAAEILLSVAAKKRGRVVLDDETRAAVRRGVDQARRGEFASDADMAALLKRHGV